MYWVLLGMHIAVVKCSWLRRVSLCSYIREVLSTSVSSRYGMGSYGFTFQKAPHRREVPSHINQFFLIHNQCGTNDVLLPTQHSPPIKRTLGKIMGGTPQCRRYIGPFLACQYYGQGLMARRIGLHSRICEVLSTLACGCYSMGLSDFALQKALYGEKKVPSCISQISSWLTTNVGLIMPSLLHHNTYHYDLLKIFRIWCAWEAGQGVSCLKRFKSGFGALHRSSMPPSVKHIEGFPTFSSVWYQVWLNHAFLVPLGSCSFFQNVFC